MIYLICLLILVAIISFVIYYYVLVSIAPIQIKSVLYEKGDLSIIPHTTIIENVGNHIVYTFFLFEKLFEFIKSKFVKTRDWFTKYETDDPLWPSFYKWIESRREKARPIIARQGYSPLSEEFFLTGSMKLPKRAYVGDSCIIELFLYPEYKFGRTSKPELKLKRNKDGNVGISLNWDNISRYLHIRLIGIGVDVTPIENEIQVLKHGVSYFSWGCEFAKSGIHSIALRCSLTTIYEISGADDNPSAINHTIKVVQFDHLTLRQVKILAAIGGIISILLSLALGLKQLGIIL